MAGQILKRRGVDFALRDGADHEAAELRHDRQQPSRALEHRTLDGDVCRLIAGPGEILDAKEDAAATALLGGHGKFLDRVEEGPVLTLDGGARDGQLIGLKEESGGIGPAAVVFEEGAAREASSGVEPHRKEDAEFQTARANIGDHESHRIGG